MDYLDMEHLSFRFRCEAGVERDFSPIPSEAAVGYQLSLRDDVPPGTEAYWDPDDRSLHFNPCQSQGSIEDDIAHEIDHVVLDDDGMKEDEQEEYAGQLCIFWRIPMHSLHRIYNRHGFVPQRFLEAFHGKASHTQILIRCGSGWTKKRRNLWWKPSSERASRSPARSACGPTRTSIDEEPASQLYWISIGA